MRAPITPGREKVIRMRGVEKDFRQMMFAHAFSLIEQYRALGLDVDMRRLAEAIREEILEMDGFNEKD